MFCVLKSKYCLLVFIISLIGVYFIIPETMFFGWYNILAYGFIVSTALSITCIFRNAKERVKVNKKKHHSFISLVLSVLGILASQVCGIGAPLCGAALGGSIGLTFLPTIAQHFFQNNAEIIIIVAIIGQMFSMYILKCFGKNYCY